MPNVDMSVTLAGMTMKNPICVASGTYGFGREYGQFCAVTFSSTCAVDAPL